jgi:Domain of unknown function (DUF4258)
VSGRRLIFSGHATKRMAQRGFMDTDVAAVLSAGDVIERYPDDTPYPSYLVLGLVAGRPVHVVAADRSDAAEIIVITVYEPHPALWDATFTRRTDP